MILHLGVIDQQYAQPSRPKRIGKPRRGVRKGSRFRQSDFIGGSQTTGDVAEILEAKYGLMQGFFDLHEPEIATAFEKSVGDAITNLIAGAPQAGSNSLAAATGDIEVMFKQFLDARGFDGLIAGVPTKAAIAGVNHRLMHPFAKGNPERPSFIDTGAFQNSFKAWVTE